MKITPPNSIKSLVEEKHISIVGNAGMLLNQSYGAQIDSADTVIRFGEAPTFNYELHVGSRTHIRLTNNHFINALLSESKHQNILNQFPKFDKDFYFKIRNEVVLIKNDNTFNYSSQPIKYHLDKIRTHNTVDFINDQIQGQCNNIAPPIASTGLLGILLAVSAARLVSCYGFDFYNCADKSRHYYPASTQSRSHQSQSHTFSKEQQYFEKLENPSLVFYN